MFEEAERNMLRGLLRTLVEKGHISTRQEALAKMQDQNWMEDLGYGHISHVMESEIGTQECNRFFDELDARSMKRLVRGIHEFRSKAFLSQKQLFERLAATQSPDVIFITCSDSRIQASLVTQTKPGELFIIRNAGNIVPPASDTTVGGEAATLEFAILKLGIRDIIVCGHSDCGAMKALVNPEKLHDMPLMSAWLKHASTTRKILDDNYANSSQDERVNLAIQENVLVQLENLRTHKCVADALAAGRLNLHGWVYQIHTGNVFAYYPELGQFLPIGDKPNADLMMKLSGGESM